MLLALRKLLSLVPAPGYGRCERCNLPWSLAEPHITRYGQGISCFPLCAWCWRDLGKASARVPYYLKLYPFLPRVTSVEQVLKAVREDRE